MGLNAKKILALGGGIATTALTSGASLALVPGFLKLGAELIPGDDSEEEKERKAAELAEQAELDDWELEMAAGWVALYRRLMDRPMSERQRRRTFEGRVESDFIERYWDEPEDDWIEAIYRMTEKVVRWRAATEPTEDPA